VQPIELLTTAEMADADRLAMAGGIAGTTLMEAAGRAVATVAIEMLPRKGGAVATVCGPGNNGGDGFVAARLLAEAGYRVRVAPLGDRSALRGDAAVMAGQWRGPIEPATAEALTGAELVIDALFGAGLTRPLDGPAADLVAAINAAGVPILAVDVPSGLDGTTGQAAGPVVEATRTVTFFRRKPGHLLMPGRRHCGPVTLADIGIPAATLATIAPRACVNAPALWRSTYPAPALDDHKYRRGHAVVVSGPPDRTGAARLGARAALRVGAGLVTVVGSSAATAMNAAHLTAVMVAALTAPKGLEDFLADTRRNAVLIGPAAGIGPATVENVLTVLASPAAVVLDADALTAFAEKTERGASFGFLGGPAAPEDATPDTLAKAIRQRSAPVVMTPHDGEFARLFPDLAAGPKVERARHAAARMGAVVVLKGPDTVIAAPDGRAAINENAPPWLATAGSGDVLAGLVLGLLAQRMPAFEAAAAAVWLHGAAAAEFGPGLIAEDLTETLPKVLRTLIAET
jgi:hydroxyethylthiazole kinase-like uncharacterized protein yjeF